VVILALVTETKSMGYDVAIVRVVAKEYEEGGESAHAIEVARWEGLLWFRMVAVDAMLDKAG